eukprot:scaffold1970_cov396-Prasinococcus_capsulatus_cf.AAC.15
MLAADASEPHDQRVRRAGRERVLSWHGAAAVAPGAAAAAAECGGRGAGSSAGAALAFLERRATVTPIRSSGPCRRTLRYKAQRRGSATKAGGRMHVHNYV